MATVVTLKHQFLSLFSHLILFYDKYPTMTTTSFYKTHTTMTTTTTSTQLYCGHGCSQLFAPGDGVGAAAFTGILQARVPFFSTGAMNLQ